MNEKEILMMSVMLLVVGAIILVANGMFLFDTIQIKKLEFNENKCYVIDREFAENVNIVEDAILRSEPSNGGIINPWNKIHNNYKVLMQPLKDIYCDYYNMSSNNTKKDTFDDFVLSKQQYEEKYNMCIVPSDIKPIKITSNKDFFKQPMSIHPSLI